MGLGIRHPYVTQGLSKLIMFLDCMANPITQQMVLTAWEMTASETGLGLTFLSEPINKIEKIIEKTWMTTFWKFLDYYKIQFFRKLENPF